MAHGLKEYADHLNRIEESLSDFRAEPYYEPVTDSLIFYIRDESSYSKRITKYFTLFLSNRDDSLVGIEVKGLKVIEKAIENLTDTDVAICNPVRVKGTDGKEFDLAVIVRQALVPEPDEPEEEIPYREINKATKGIRVNKRNLCHA